MAERSGLGCGVSSRVACGVDEQGLVVSDCTVLLIGPLQLDSYGAPPVLVLASENDSKQLCAVNYLKYNHFL